MKYRQVPDNIAMFASTMQRYNGLGLLAMRDQVDLVYEYTPAPIIVLWEKFRDILIHERTYLERPEYYQGLEYLYNEMIKREKPGSPKGFSLLLNP